MSQTAFPFLFMRGGTSRGPYLNAADLPEDRDTLTEILIAIIGSGHPLNIDGTGGGAAAIEMGLVEPDDGTTDVKIRAVNTGARVLSTVQTPDGIVSYQGDAATDGVSGTSAPIELKFMDVTGALFLTGSRKDVADGHRARRILA